MKPTGNAPIMKKKKWAVDADKPIGWIIEFVRKYLKLESQERLVTSLLFTIITFLLLMKF